MTAQAPPADGPVEPLYGDTYLPRKFKIGVAWPGDNCIDIHSHDVGIVPTLSEGLTGELTGFVVLAGGGMGMSHSRPDDTYPVLGRPVAWVPPEDLADVVEAIVATQRDFGNRDDRHRARLKYTLEEHGIEWLRAEIETRTGRAVAEPVELPAVDGRRPPRLGPCWTETVTRSACPCRPAASPATTAMRSARSSDRGWSRRSGSRPARTSCCAA